MILKTFQNNLVDNVVRHVESIFNERTPEMALIERKRREPAVISVKSPTGSGKTLMVSEIIRKSLSESCVIVLSPGAGNLEEQTREALKRNLSDSKITVDDLTPSLFSAPAPSGSVFVKNWESLCGVNKKTGEYRTLMARDGERKNVFDWIADTIKSNVPVVIVIDEAHYGSKTDATSIADFLRKISEVIVAAGGFSPVTIEATATPIENATAAPRVREVVPYIDVINAGLMRKSIRLNDGITNVDKIDDLDAESVLLELAYQKQEYLNGVYSSAGSKYHSLIAIQIPNSTLGKNCRARIVEFFQKKGITVENGQLAEFFNENKTVELSAINSADSPVKVLLYKQAIATGWDCSRAQILVGFRHIKSRSFSEQNLGRFLRTTEARHYTADETPNYADLNVAYVYSNNPLMDIYQDNEVIGKGSVSVLEEIPLVAEARSLVDSYNSHNFPNSYVKRTKRLKVKTDLISEVFKNAVTELNPVFVNERFSSQVMVSANMDVEGLADVGAHFEKIDELDVARGKAEIAELWRFTVANLVNTGADKSLDAAVVDDLSRMIVSKFKKMFNKIFKNDDGFVLLSTHDTVLTLLAQNNQEQVVNIISLILEDDIFNFEGSDDLSEVLSKNAKLAVAGSHEIGGSVSVGAGSETVPSGLAPFYLYGTSEGKAGVTAKYEESGTRSAPERRFEENLLLLQENGNFKVKYFYKNPSYVSSNSFSIGVHLVVKYVSENVEKISNFFPDYVVFVENTNTGKVFPVIVEVKGAESHNSIDLLKAKGRAAQQYMTNTGLPFILLQESADGIFNRYSTQETFDQFLIRASQSELKSFDKAERQDGIPQDLSWMSTLGLSDEQIESTDNE